MFSNLFCPKIRDPIIKTAVAAHQLRNAGLTLTLCFPWSAVGTHQVLHMVQRDAGWRVAARVQVADAYLAWASSHVCSGRQRPQQGGNVRWKPARAYSRHPGVEGLQDRQTSAALHLPPDAEAAEERRKAWQFKVSEGCLSFTSWPHPTRLLGPLATVSVCFLLSLFRMLFFEGLPRAWSSANGLRSSEILHVLHEILHIKWPAVRSLSQYNY